MNRNLFKRFTMKQIIAIHFKNKNNKSAKYLLTGLTLLFSLSLFAQDNAPKAVDTLSVFANPLFDVLLAVVILLLIVISILGLSLIHI